MNQPREEPVLHRVRRLDSIRLDENDRTYFTEEGYLVDHPILTSVGIFEYKNKDGSIRRELRLPQYVFDEKSLKSYRGKPIIITHAAGKVDKDNVDREQIGTILSDGYQDGEDVRAEIIIHNTDLMKKSGLKELSLGYNLDLIEQPGTWNGEPYDAIQTNIVINHLALVSSARAGDQARLNIDGSDEPELKGGKINMATQNTDSIDMTPEELMEAIKAYKATHGGEGKATPPAEPTVTAKDDDDPVTDPVPTPPVAQPPVQQEEKKDGDTQAVLDTAVKALEAVVNALKGCAGTTTADGECTDPVPEVTPAGENKDGSGDQSQSMNADSADELFRQRLSICRVGDKLRMDGLEEKSILDAKKAIIAKVLPDMRLDGKNTAYIDAAYDLAVANAGKRKDVNYQRQQMLGDPAQRLDGSETVSMAASARQRMLEREGGNQ